MSRRSRLLLCALAFLTGACETTVERQPDYTPRRVVELGRWPITQGERLLGFVVLLEIQDRTGPLRYYRVENDRRQWLGHASLYGRFSRRVPFRDDEEDLGLWPMLTGLSRLLEVQGPVAIAGRPNTEVMEAAARRQDEP